MKRRPQRERLEELLELAQSSRGWSRKQLARELERDVHNLVPSGGVPRVDLILRLSEALDWSPQDVIDELCRQSPGGDQSVSAEATDERGDWNTLERQGQTLHQLGDFERLADLAAREYEVARTPDERARSRNHQYLAYDGMGRYGRWNSSVTAAPVAAGRILRSRSTLKTRDR